MLWRDCWRDFCSLDKDANPILWFHAGVPCATTTCVGWAWLGYHFRVIAYLCMMREQMKLDEIPFTLTCCDQRRKRCLRGVRGTCSDEEPQEP